MGWEFELTDLNGVGVGLLQPREVRVTRRLNAASTVELEGEIPPPPYQAARTYAQEVKADAPAVYYRLGDPGLAAVARDDMGVHDGTYVNDPAQEQDGATGDGDTAVAFDGTNERVLTTTLGALGSNLTTSSWEWCVRTTTSSTIRAMFGVVNLGTTVIVRVLANTDMNEVAAAGKTLVQIRGANGLSLKGEISAPIYDGEFHHCVVVIERDVAPSAFSFYVDGVAQAVTYSFQDTITGANFGFPLTLAARNNRGTIDQHFPGTLDEFAAYPVRLTAARVAAHYAALSVPPGELSTERAAGDGQLSTARVVRGWRSPASGGPRVLRATGKIRTALQLAAARDSLDTLSIQATDGYGVLSDRLNQETFGVVGFSPNAIVEALVNLQNLRAPTGLSVAGMIPGGPGRDRTYPRGKNVGEAILQLAEVDDGFYFLANPVASGSTFSQLVLRYPAPGGDSTASFEFGVGTAANLAKVQVDVRPPVNFVTAFGAGDGDEQLVATASDPASIAAYGLVDVSQTFSDVIEQATLDQHARDLLRPEERRTFQVEVSSSTGNGELVTPSPWDDFDVGDTVRLSIRTSALSYTGRALVKAFTVTIDANGTERLSALDFQQED